MDCFITSLDDHHKMLKIYSIGGSAPGDIGIDAGFLTGVYLLSSIGAGNSNFKSPVYDASLQVIKLFRQNKGCTVQGFAEAAQDIDFSFDQNDIITFATPNEIPEIAHKRLDFVRSKNGFFGTHTRMGFDMNPTTLEANDIVWLCGPEDKNLAKKFGAQAYNLRRGLFGSLYEMAASDPPRMQNPIYPMANGQNFIIKGNKNAYH